MSLKNMSLKSVSLGNSPQHPGQFILRSYMQPFGISCRYLSKRLDVAPSTLNRVITGQNGISPEMSLRLSKALGRSPESWLAMQHSYDLWVAKNSVELNNVKKVKLKSASTI